MMSLILTQLHPLFAHLSVEKKEVQETIVAEIDGINAQIDPYF